MTDLLSEPIPKGSVEHIIVDVTDRLGNMTDLSSSAPKFDVRVKNDTFVFVQEGITATVIGMRVFCLVDTTMAAYVSGKYELFVYFTNVPESPRLGPIEFMVDE